MDSPTLCAANFFATEVCQLCVMFLKATNPINNAVGKQPVTTIFYLSLYFFFTVGVIFFIRVMGIFFKGYAKLMSSEAKAKIELVIRFQERLFPAIVVSAFFATYLPLLSLAYPSHASELSIPLYVGLSAIWVVLLAFILSFLSVMKAELKVVIAKSTSSQLSLDGVTTTSPFSKIYFRLTLIDALFKVLSPFIIGAMVSLALWPFIQRKSAYLTAIMSIFCSLTMAFCVFLFAPDNAFPFVRYVSVMAFTIDSHDFSVSLSGSRYLTLVAPETASVCAVEGKADAAAGNYAAANTSKHLVLLTDLEAVESC